MPPATICFQKESPQERKMERLTIGRLSKQVGMSSDTIRFYEVRGMLAPPRRGESGYRIYPESAINRLKFIRLAKGLGFTLDELKEMLELRDNPRADKADVKQRSAEKIEVIDKKILDLTRMRQALEQLSASCDGTGPLIECPIVEALTGKDHDQDCQ
jgi:Cu(I)-responsive transcriptional regulator